MIEKKFKIVFTPDVVDIGVVEACGFQPRDSSLSESSDENFPFFKIQNSNLALSATSEILLAGMHCGKSLKSESLPLRYAGFSHCFRPEAGHYGKESRGLFRLHQFSKVEMFSFCTSNTSSSILQEFLSIQKEIISELGLYARTVNISTSELGNSAAQKYDIEIWYPMKQDWGEVSSASNCTNYQTTRLAITSQDEPVHTVNATAIATSRIIQGIIESFYHMDEKEIPIPSILFPYTFGLKKISRN